MRYTLRQLEVFLAIAQCQNLTRAAESLAMSQSAASSALKDLEQQFDVQFFDRVGKRLHLNEQGLQLREQAEPLMAQAKELEQTLSEHRLAGPINIGATLSIGNYLAIRMVADYMRRYPKSPIHLEVANTEQIAQRVLNFELDMGLIEGEYHHPDLDIRPWRSDELVVFCHPEHELAQRKRISEQDLLNAPWILREPGSGTRQAFERAMQGILPKLTIALELQHTEAIKRAVEAKLGIGCLSRMTLHDAFQRGNLVPLSFPDRDFTRTLYQIIHRNKYPSTGLKNWLNLCEDFNKE